MMKKILLSVMMMLVSGLAFANVTLTTNMAHCEVTGVTGGGGNVVDSDRLDYNRLTIVSDASGGTSFKCPVQMVTDYAISKIEVRYALDSNATSANSGMLINDPLLPYYTPQCSLRVEYIPGGSDTFQLELAKSSPSGGWDILELNNPVMQQSGNDAVVGGILECHTSWYIEEARFFGMRIHY